MWQCKFYQQTLKFPFSLSWVCIEVKELQTYFKAKIYRFPRGNKEVEMYKDGGIAIIDQWIASHAR